MACIPLLMVSVMKVNGSRTSNTAVGCSISLTTIVTTVFGIGITSMGQVPCITTTATNTKEDGTATNVKGRGDIPLLQVSFMTACGKTT